MATDRHNPHARHGKDLLILQASHVGDNLSDAGKEKLTSRPSVLMAREQHLQITFALVG
jgi:hypothetical protein